MKLAYLSGWLALFLVTTAMADDKPQVLFEFAGVDAAKEWQTVNDGVMGGVSEGKFKLTDRKTLEFFGTLSLENNGGFASVRCRPADLGVPGASGYVLEVLGDGRRYKLNLRTDDAFDGVNHQAVFDPPAGVWTSIRLPLAAFTTTFRGRPVAGVPPLDPARVRQMGLMIADRQAGPFALAIRSIGIA